MEESKLIQRSYHLCQRHFDFFDDINKNNHSQALRTILDSIINGEEQTKRKKTLDNSIMFISFGFFFIMFTYLTSNSIGYSISLLLGVFLITYGGIGGIKSAIRRTKHYH